MTLTHFEQTLYLDCISQLSTILDGYKQCDLDLSLSIPFEDMNLEELEIMLKVSDDNSFVRFAILSAISKLSKLK